MLVPTLGDHLHSRCRDGRFILRTTHRNRSRVASLKGHCVSEPEVELDDLVLGVILF